MPYKLWTTNELPVKACVSTTYAYRKLVSLGTVLNFLTVYRIWQKGMYRCLFVLCLSMWHCMYDTSQNTYTSVLKQIHGLKK